MEQWPHQHEERVQVAQLAGADGAADPHAGALHHLVALHHLQQRQANGFQSDGDTLIASTLILSAC